MTSTTTAAPITTTSTSPPIPISASTKTAAETCVDAMGPLSRETSSFKLIVETRDQCELAADLALDEGFSALAANLDDPNHGMDDLSEAEYRESEDQWVSETRTLIAEAAGS